MNRGTDMATGIEYITGVYKKPKFKHMRLMLQALYDVAQTNSALRITDIAKHFNWNDKALADHIRGNFTPNEINLVHHALVDALRNGTINEDGGRGNGNGSNVVMSGIEQEANANELINDIFKTGTKMPAKREKKTEQQAESGEMLDSSKFVLRTEFDEFSDATENDITDIRAATEQHILATKNGFESVAREFVKVREEIAAVKVSYVEIKPIDRANIKAGVQHKCYVDLLTILIAAIEDGAEPCNLWIHGPAGTGKTTSAKNASVDLSAYFGRKFEFYAMSALETGFQIMGYMDAGGNYVTTLFRQAYEHGGVIILDEVDSYNPNAATALNGALANGYCAFPDRMITRHKDCVIIAGANTTGQGGTIEYSGRNKIDAATLDRFEMLDWPIDEALEAHICANDKWTDYVRKVRANVARQKIKGVMITPRASVKGAARLRAGIPHDLVVRTCLRKGIPDAIWNMIK